MFFGQNELSDRLLNKADIRTITDLDIMKANRKELASTEGLIQNLNDRVKHLSSVMYHLTSSMLPVKN